MFLIDFEKKGNVIRLYFGEDDQYWGDDWDDAPYEHNAGQVYDEFVKCHIDYAFPFNYFVTEPADDYNYRGNSPYSKEDMKNHKCPCLIVTNDEKGYSELFLSYHNLCEDQIDDDLKDMLGDAPVVRLFYGDNIETVDEKLKSVKGVVIYASIT